MVFQTVSARITRITEITLISTFTHTRIHTMGNYCKVYLMWGLGQTVMVCFLDRMEDDL